MVVPLHSNLSVTEAQPLLFLRKSEKKSGRKSVEVGKLKVRGILLRTPGSGYWEEVRPSDPPDRKHSDAASQPHTHSRPETRPTNAGGNASVRKIMVVEDESIVALDLMMTLRQMGYQIVGHVLSGEDAIQEAAHSQPDLILMDIRLKGTMDGVEAARQIHERFKGIRVIFLSAFTDDGTTQRVKTIGFGQYLRKPYSRSELQAAIEQDVH